MWYIIFNGQQVGPMSKQELLNYNLNPESMVWSQGMPDWTRAANVPELTDVLQIATQRAQGAPQGGFQQPPYQGGFGGYNGGFAQRGGYDQFGRYIPMTDKSRTTAGILALLLGALGIQYFYVGKTGGGLITLLLSCITCGLWEIVTFIQGIVILCMSDEEFERKYVLSKSTFPLF